MDDDIGMLRLGLDVGEQRDYQRRKVEINKAMNGMLRQARENARLDTCYICGKPCSSFCNSHSIPQFCLKRITKDGKLYPSILNSGLPLADREYGVKEAGTFQLICRDCDSKIFQEYETPEAYASVPKGRVLAQICMKNYLQMISKRRREIELYKLEAKMLHPGAMNHAIGVANLDLLEFKSGFERAYKASQGNHDDWYYPCYFQKLDYVIPFAFQGQVDLVCDFDGEVINDLYNMSPNYHLEEIHIVAFPLATESVVLMIIDSKQKRYRKFYRQLKKLPLEDQLAAINFIIFSYSENVFISKEIDKNVLSNKAFWEMCQVTNIAVSPSPVSGHALDSALETFNLSKRGEVPNLLSKKYALPT